MWRYWEVGPLGSDQVIRAEASRMGLVIQERSLASFEDTVRQWLSIKMQARHWIYWCFELELPKALGLWEIGFFFFLSHSVFSILVYYMPCLKRLKQSPSSIHIPLIKSPRALNGLQTPIWDPLNSPLETEFWQEFYTDLNTYRNQKYNTSIITSEVILRNVCSITNYRGKDLPKEEISTHYQNMVVM